MTPDEKYFPGNRENLQESIKMKLSKKLKSFSAFFTAFLKSTFNLKHFKKKKDEPHSQGLSEIIDCEIGAYVNAKRVMFQYDLEQSTC